MNAALAKQQYRLTVPLALLSKAPMHPKSA